MLLGMNKLNWTLIALFAVLALNAQQPEFVWAAQMQGDDSNRGYAVVTDEEGNIYLAGRLRGTTDFDPGPDTFYLSSAGDADIFIQKLDTDGNLLWAKRMGSEVSDYVVTIATDDVGNLYLTGLFAKGFDFDPGPGVYELEPFGGWDIFVEKLDAAGNFVWARQMGGIHYDEGYSIAVDSQGNVYTTGRFDGTADFGQGNTLTSAGSSDCFVQKLDADGNLLWVKRMGGIAYDAGNYITVDDAGNVYVGGVYFNTADFDPNEGETLLSSAGMSDMFIAKLNEQGDLLWAKSVGGEDYDNLFSATADAWGNVYLTGAFRGIADFDPDGDTFYLTSTGVDDIFLLKLDAEGHFLWARRMGGEEQDYGYSVATDIAGNVYSTGYFYKQAEFDSVLLTTPVSGINAFIQKYNPAGDFLWAKQIESDGYSLGRFLTVDLSGNIYLTGTFNGQADLDPGPSVEEFSTAQFSADVFVVKLGQCPFTESSISVSACGSYISPSGLYTWTESGTYTDAIPNASCGDSIITIALTLFEPDTSVLLNGAVLTAQATGAGYQYQWLDCNASYAPLAGETGQSFTATASGSYAVEISDGICRDTSSCEEVVLSSLWETTGQRERLRLYPNPVMDVLHLDLSTQKSLSSLEVYDAMGRLWMSEKISGAEGRYRLSVGALPAGLYVLVGRNAQGMAASGRFVKLGGK